VNELEERERDARDAAFEAERIHGVREQAFKFFHDVVDEVDLSAEEVTDEVIALYKQSNFTPARAATQLFKKLKVDEDREALSLGFSSERGRLLLGHTIVASMGEYPDLPGFTKPSVLALTSYFRHDLSASDSKGQETTDVVVGLFSQESGLGVSYYRGLSPLIKVLTPVIACSDVGSPLAMKVVRVLQAAHERELVGPLRPWVEVFLGDGHVVSAGRNRERVRAKVESLSPSARKKFSAQL
jgi:hypothetical protein